LGGPGGELGVGSGVGGGRRISGTRRRAVVKWEGGRDAEAQREADLSTKPTKTRRTRRSTKRGCTGRNSKAKRALASVPFPDRLLSPRVASCSSSLRG